MASDNYTIPVNKAATLKSSNATTNYSGATSVYAGVVDGGSALYNQFAIFATNGFPSAEGKIISNFKFSFKTHDILPSGSTGSFAFVALGKTWVENTITYLKAIMSPTNLDGLAIDEKAVLGSDLDIPFLAKTIYDRIGQYGIWVETDDVGKWTNQPYLTVPIWSYLAPLEVNRPYFSFTLSDSVPVPTPITPVRKFVDPSQAVRFTWDYANAVGGAQKSYAIETSLDGVVWTPLAGATTGATTVVIAPNTIITNTKYWRIKVTSFYDIESEWSSPVQIVLKASPVCTINSVTSTPRPVIEWTCSDQQAYQVVCGSYDTGVVYGTGKTHKVATYLPDGETEIMVRAQGSLGLWSNWSKSTITIANTPGEAINLSVYAQDHRARLAWSGGEGGTFYILRDGIPIAKTTEVAYTDELTIGKRTYQVLEQLAGEYYTRSNAATVTLKAKSKVVSSVDSVAWLSLKYNLEQSPTIGESVQQSVVLTHYQGRVYPVAEGSKFIDKSMSFTVAFMDAADQAEFEALIGKTVCLKTRTGRMVIGSLSGYEVENGKVYSQFSASVMATDFVEEIAYD